MLLKYDPFLYVFSIVLSFIESGGTLECYGCMSVLDGSRGCPSPFSATSDVTMINCAGSCTYTVTNENNGCDIYTRECDPSQTTDSPVCRFSERHHQNNKSSRYLICSCGTDFCNGAPMDTHPATNNTELSITCRLCNSELTPSCANSERPVDERTAYCSSGTCLALKRLVNRQVITERSCGHPIRNFEGCASFPNTIVPLIGIRDNSLQKLCGCTGDYCDAFAQSEVTGPTVPPTKAPGSGTARLKPYLLELLIFISFLLYCIV